MLYTAWIHIDTNFILNLNIECNHQNDPLKLQSFMTLCRLHVCGRD